MDNQQQHQKLAHSSPGSDHHIIYNCHKCGWPYPNPHPSAKHRRAHKRICGKTEGYKMFDSEGSHHSSVSFSDDEHLSDEDHKPPKVLEASSHEKVIVGTRESPNKSEDKVSSDVAAGFLDGGVGGRVQGRVEDAGESATTVEKIFKSESKTTQPTESGPVSEAVQPRGSSPENIEMQHSGTAESTSDILVYGADFPRSSASFSYNPVLHSVSDRTEGLAVVLDDSRKAAVDDLHPIKSEALEDASHENEKTSTVDDVVDASLNLPDRTTLEGQKETYFKSNLQDVKMSINKQGETAETIPKLDETLKVNSESSQPKAACDVLRLQEEHSDGFQLKTSKSDVSPEVESGEQVNSLAEKKEIAGLNYVDSGYTAEAISKLDETLKLNSESVPPKPERGVLQLQEEHNDQFYSKASKSDVFPEGESGEHENFLAEKKVEIAGLNYVDSETLKPNSESAPPKPEHGVLQLQEEPGDRFNSKASKSHVLPEVESGEHVNLAEKTVKIAGLNYVDSGETAEAVSKPDETLKPNSESVPPKAERGVLQMQEEHSDRFNSKASKSDVFPEVESGEHVNLAEKTVNIAGLNYVDSGETAEAISKPVETLKPNSESALLKPEHGVLQMQEEHSDWINSKASKSDVFPEVESGEHVNLAEKTVKIAGLNYVDSGETAEAWKHSDLFNSEASKSEVLPEVESGEHVNLAEKTVKIAGLNYVDSPEHGVLQMQEEHSDRFNSKASKSDVFPEVESGEHVNLAEKRVNIAGLNYVDSGETAEAISKPVETLKPNSESALLKPEQGVLQMQEEHSDRFNSKASKSDDFPEVESGEHVNLAEKTVKIAGLNYVDSPEHGVLQMQEEHSDRFNSKASKSDVFPEVESGEHVNLAEKRVNIAGLNYVDSGETAEAISKPVETLKPNSESALLKPEQGVLQMQEEHSDRFNSKASKSDDFPEVESGEHVNLAEKTVRITGLNYVDSGETAEAWKHSDLFNSEASKSDVLPEVESGERVNLAEKTVKIAGLNYVDSGETAEAISKPDETLKRNSESAILKPEHGVFQMQEEHSDRFNSKASKSDVFPEVESGEHVNLAEKTAKIVLNSESPPKAEHGVLQLLEEHSDLFNSEASKSDVLPEVESGEHVNSLDEKTVEIRGLIYVGSADLVEKKGEADANVHALSVSDDIHEVDNPGVMLKDFKDHKAMKLGQSSTLGSEQAKDNQDITQGTVLQESSQSNQCEGVAISSSDKHVLEDSVQLDQCSSVRIVKDVLVEGDANMFRREFGSAENQRSKDVGATADVVMPHIDGTISASFSEGQGSPDISSDTLQQNYSGGFDAALVNASGNVGTVPDTHLVGESGYKKSEKSGLSGDYNREEAREVDYAENPVTVTAAEAESSGPEIQVNPATNLQEVDGAGDRVKIETGKDDITGDDAAAARPPKDETGVDNSNSHIKERCSENPVVAPESAKNLADIKINPETNLQEEDSGGNFEKIGTKKEDITGNARDAAACHVKGETGVDNLNSPLKESCLQHPAVTLDSTKNLSEVKINPGTDIHDRDAAGYLVKVETKKEGIARDAFDVASHHVKDKIGVDNNSSPSQESLSEYPVVTPGSAKNLSEVKISPGTNLQEGGTVGNFDEVETKKENRSRDASDAAARHATDGIGVNSRNSPSKESFLEHPVVTSEPAKNFSEVRISPGTNVQEGGTARNFDNVETKEDNRSRYASDASAHHATDGIGVDDNHSPSKESFSKNPIINPETGLPGGDIVCHFEKFETVNDDVNGSASDAAAHPANDETVVDNGNNPKKESCLEYPALESAKGLAEVEINPEANLQEGASDGNFEKVETRQEKITVDASDAAAHHAKGETGIDNNSSPKEIYSEHSKVASESATTLFEVGVNPETLREGGTAGNSEKVEIKKDDIIGNASDTAAVRVKDESGIDNGNGPSKQSRSEHPVSTPESAKNLTEVETNPETSLDEGATGRNFEKFETKKDEVTGVASDAVKVDTEVDNNSSPSKEICSENPVVGPVSANTLFEVKVKPESALSAGDPSGNFDKHETKRGDITRDAFDDTAGHTKGELGVYNSVSPTKETGSDNVLVTPDSFNQLSECDVDPATNLLEEDMAGNFEKVETKKENVAGYSCNAAAGHVEGEVGNDYGVGPTEERVSEKVVIPSESANQLSELNPAANPQEGNDICDPDKGRIEKFVEHGTESKGGSVEENLQVQPEPTGPESASHPQEFQTVAKDVVIGSMEKSKETVCRGKDCAFNSNRLYDDVVKDIIIETTDDKLVVKTAVEDNSARQSDAASGLGSESFQRESDGQQFGDSTHDMSIDSGSQSDSLENNWGSVSVLSVQSDAQPVIDGDTSVPVESLVIIGERADPKESKPASEKQYPDKSDMFEAPSFMTLVEPEGENDQKATAVETQTGQNSQLQPGWFPSITNVVNESQGRKKNEERIAKVTNWSPSKPHSPLKNLLGEASIETRAKSPKRKDLAPSPQEEDKAAPAVDTVPDPESSLDQTANREIGNEWNSPARYPAEIKREKRKPKGRPYWAQFMCCSSVH